MFQPAIPNCGYFIVLTLDDGSSPLNGGIRSFSCLRDTPQIAPEKGLGVDEMAICLLGRNVVCVKYLFRESPGEKGKMRKHDFYPKLKLKGHKNGAII